MGGWCERVSSNVTLSPVLKATSAPPLPTQFEAVVDQTFALPSPRHVRFEGGCKADITTVTVFVYAVPSKPVTLNRKLPNPEKPPAGVKTAKWPFEIVTLPFVAPLTE